MLEIKGRKAKVLITENEIKQKVKELAERVSKDFSGEEIFVVGVLKGAFIFMADFVRELNGNVKIDFVQLSSYHTEMESSGEVIFVKDLSIDVEGKNILVVDDIIDTGRTLLAFVEVLKKRGAKSVKTCVLLDKRERREVNYNADYYGFVIPDKFVIGYGLDWGEEGRTLKDIYAIE